MEQLIQDFLKKKIWAIVGVSENKEKFGYIIYQYLKSNTDYLVYPINHRMEEIEGEKCYPSLKSLPQKPQVVNFLVPPAVTAKVARDGISLGVNHFWMQPGSEDNEAITWLEEKGALVVYNACVMRELKGKIGKS